MNQHNLILMGRATQDGQVLESKNGKEYSKFGLAVNEYRGKEEGETASFYDVVSFLRQPRAVAKKIRKGDVVLVFGRPEVQAYESKSGELKAKLSVTANYLQGYFPPTSLRKEAEEPEEAL